MPTYDYECQECKLRFEAFQNMCEEPLKECVKCKGKVKRLIGAGAGIIFKGSGFYVNDYKKNNGSPSGAKNGGKESSEKPAPAPKSETASTGTASSEAGV